MGTFEKKPSFQNPIFGKLSAVQQAYESGEKTSHVPPDEPIEPDPIVGTINPIDYVDPVQPQPYPPYVPFIIPVYRELFPCTPGNYIITQQLGLVSGE